MNSIILLITLHLKEPSSKGDVSITVTYKYLTRKKTKHILK